MNEMMGLATIGALLLLSLSIIYCTDAILQEMAKERTLLEIQFGETYGRQNNYSEGLKQSASVGRDTTLGSGA